MKKNRIVLSFDVYDRRIHEGAERHVAASATKTEIERTSALPWYREFPHAGSAGAIVLVRLQENFRPLRAALKKMRYPVVLLGFEGEVFSRPQVQEDNYAVGRLAAGYYLQRRFRRFAVACQGVDAGYRRRVQGFEETLEQHGYPVRRMIYQDHVHKEARHGRRLPWETFLLRNISHAGKPLAILALDDYIGRSVLSYCAESGIRVPEEVAVLGIGNDHMLCDYAATPLSSIDTNLGQLGWKAAELLHAMLDGEAAPAGPLRIPPLGVVERRSTEILSAEDPRAVLALRYLMDNLHAPLTSAAVARAAGLSPSRMDRIFQVCFGRTVKKEIIRLRMQRIRELLATTNMLAKEIAAVVGFRTLTHMSRVFRQENKVTPRQYRERLDVADIAPWETPQQPGRLIR